MPAQLDGRRTLCDCCDNQARATCRFCAAGLCRDHVKAARFVSGFESFYGLAPGLVSDHVVVDNAIWCGQCSVLLNRSRDGR